MRTSFRGHWESSVSDGERSLNKAAMMISLTKISGLNRTEYNLSPRLIDLLCKKFSKLKLRISRMSAAADSHMQAQFQ